jgi:hypothetical protein
MPLRICRAWVLNLCSLPMLPQPFIGSVEVLGHCTVLFRKPSSVSQRSTYGSATHSNLLARSLFPIAPFLFHADRSKLGITLKSTPPHL